MSAGKVVIARAADENDELSEAYSPQGFSPCQSLLCRSNISKSHVPRSIQILLWCLASANGVRAFECLSDLRPILYTVGRNTADEARRVGFTRIETAAGTVDDLVDILLKVCVERAVEPLYVRGRI